MAIAAIFGRETGMEAVRSRAKGQGRFGVGGGVGLADGVGRRGLEWGLEVCSTLLTLCQRPRYDLKLQLGGRE